MPASADARRRSLPKNFGPFILERRLAVGGSAEVFLAHPKHGQAPAPRFVIKRLLPGKQRDFKVLEREASLLRAIQHPNVVRMYGAGVIDGEPYLAMEYVDGVDLYRLLRRCEAEERRVPPGLAAYIAIRVSEALGAVHSVHDASGRALNIVHRDVTPSNVYLSTQGEVKLGDFGIAHFEESDMAGPNAGLKGKFGYLAPEQVAGEPFDHRADLFVLTALFGEMLLGERIFPGSGHLAVLLAIRDGNVEPLRRAYSKLPPGLPAFFEKGLEQDPSDRFQSAAELGSALVPFEKSARETLKRTLAEWVKWAVDSSQLQKRIEGKIRDSVERMKAVRSPSTAFTVPAPRTQSPVPAASAPDTEPQPSLVRRSDGSELGPVPLSRLIELVATGELAADDEVALMGNPFQRVREIDELARHLLPSTTATTSRLFEPGAPDFSAKLEETPMLKVLARLRRTAETGALFVQRRDAHGPTRRKEIYLRQGRVHHVASSEREELLGEYMVRRGRIGRAELELALSSMSSFGGRLGDTLIGLGLVSAVDIFRAIRDQGRDRVAALCGWSVGDAVFYRNTEPGPVNFPLDLDLASPMMAGVIAAAKGGVRAALPSDDTPLSPGPRSEAARSRRERGNAPMSLQLVPGLLRERLTVGQAIERLTQEPESPSLRRISEQEACAALLTARSLGWLMLSER
jgi:serine/threonine-protein kinase